MKMEEIRKALLRTQAELLRAFAEIKKQGEAIEELQKKVADR